MAEMSAVTTIGVDVAKNVLQICGMDLGGNVVLRRRVRRAGVAQFFARQSRCVVGMEACASSHHWARLVRSLGHDVRLVPPQYVKAYVKRNKNDAADAEAICEAVMRPTMRLVPIKTEEQQAVLSLHRVRDLLSRQRVMLINALRGHCAEFGVIAPAGVESTDQLVAVVRDEGDTRLPAEARAALLAVVVQIEAAEAQMREVTARLTAWRRQSEVCRRLETIPGIGPLTSSAIAAAVVDPGRFKSGRDFAAWLGLTPRQNQSGEHERLGPISKRGDTYLRRMLIHGGRGVVSRMRSVPAEATGWVQGLLERRHFNVAVVAMAAKIARVAWALLVRGGVYAREGRAVAA
jgi:transposase